MKFRIYISAVFLLLLWIFSACSNDDASNQEEAMEAALQAIIDDKVGPDKLQGVTVSIRIGDEEKWSLAGGISDNDTPMQTNMRFGLASITKTAVAAAVLKLEEEGLLSLDDTIGDWLTLDSPNVDDSITIFQLLNHLTGVMGYFHHPDIWPMVEADLNTPIPPEDLVDFIGTPVFNPGDMYEYSNSNYLLLGLIIRAAAQEEVGAVMRSRFWEPLQLNDIYFGAEESPTGPIATPWRDGDDDGILENIASEYGPAYHSVFYTAADVFSTASDLSMWAQHLYRGNALSEASKTKMLNFLYVDSGTPYWDGYGLGVRRIHIAGRETWGHTGGMRGYGTFMLYEPISNVSIAMLNNQSRSENGPVLRLELVEEILQEVFDSL